MLAKRRGSALLEAVIGLVVLATAGTGLITLMGQTTAAMQSLARTERQTLGAAAELSTLVTFNRADVLARLGRTVSHGWIITITANGRALFTVNVASSDTTASLLHTTIYRPDTTDVQNPQS